MDAKMAFGEESKPWFFGAGIACQLDEQSKLRVKLDRYLQLGSSLQLRVNTGILLTLAMSLDLLQPTSGQHKVGLGIDVEA